MTAPALFPSLGDWGDTRQTMHLYSQAMAVVPRAHATFHPKWWHISLSVEPDGLATARVAGQDSHIWLKMDLVNHQIHLHTADKRHHSWSMQAGLTSTELGEAIQDKITEFGYEGEYAVEKYENDDPRRYDPAAAERFFTALQNADRIFKQHRAGLTGDVGPVQLWPHGFDLAFEWFGTRVERYQEHGEMRELPAQLNLGFYPGSNDSETYFYSNPWPFAGDVLLSQPLPQGASWHTAGWQGTILPYGEIMDDPDAERRLLEYAWAVFELTSPTLMAD